MCLLIYSCNNSSGFIKSLCSNGELRLPAQLCAAHCDGVDGSQMAIWTSTEDVISKEHVHDYDEYFIVVDGEYKLKINNVTTTLRRGDEYHIPKGTLHSRESKKGTRTIYAFGSKRAKRINEDQS